MSKGTAGVWNGTIIKLFRVQETAVQTPSLLAPRGAVDAVGSNLANRIGIGRLAGIGGTSAPRSANGVSGNTPTSAPVAVRDV